MVEAGEPILTALAALPVRVWARSPCAVLPFPLDQPACRLYARGRHALWQGARALGIGPGDELLAPAYHHGSDVEALVRTGAVCRFYEAGERLEPDQAELEALLGPRTRALHLIHYLGFPQDVERWREWCDRHGLLLLEDAAQGWLGARDGRPLGSCGDLAIFSLYKTFGLPDGAALVARAPVPEPRRRRRPAAGSLALEHAVWLVGRSPSLGRLAAPRARRLRRYDAERDFALGDPESPPSAATMLALARVADPGAAERRRRHYLRLLADLAERCPPAFRRLPSEASPFVFPLESDDKALLLRRLRERGVRALDLWSVPHPSLDSGRFRRAAALRARIVGLPVHQELRPRDLERLVRAVRESTRLHG